MNKISEKTLQSEERMAVCLKCMPKTHMMTLRENSVKVTIHEWHSYGLTVNFQVGANLHPDLTVKRILIFSNISQ